jgi:hypothetical protein
MSFGLYSDRRRVEFMKMRGPRGKGHAQMAVSRVKGSGPETPKVEDFPIGDFEDDEQVCSTVTPVKSQHWDRPKVSLISEVSSFQGVNSFESERR